VRLFPIPLLRSLALGVAALAAFVQFARAESTLVVEADTGKVLFADNPTYPWYPASTSKLMTMYLTLKAVKDHRLSMDSLLTVSPNAVAQAPSKMGFAAGTQLTVDNALKMMMVKSANDIAVVLAEGVGGSIEKFADEMNAASRRLGMTQSSWVNPNGLPADEQITSARDMAILARAILKELPEYEMYWHIPAIKFGRRVMRNTNGLIGRYADADGMKTGFICASGFNVVATATRNGRKLIVVVFGAHSGMGRSEKAAQLFEKGFASGGLSWLMPSLGTVDALQPIAASPPNLRDEMCGKHRKRPAAEEEEEESVQTSNDVDPSSAYAVTLQSMRGKPAGGPLLGPMAAFVPVPVYIGPARAMPDAGAVQTAAKPPGKPTKKKPATAIAAAPAPEPKASAEKPATANAAGYSLTPSLKLPSLGIFSPASSEEKPAAPPKAAEPAKPVHKKKTAAKPQPKADAAGAKPEQKTAAKPKADSKKTAAAKQPDTKSERQ
jgi:D-alanyl-D-alanine carboxypeptidase